MHENNSATLTTDMFLEESNHLQAHMYSQNPLSDNIVSVKSRLGTYNGVAETTSTRPHTVWRMLGI